MRKKIIIIASILLIGLVFGGCSLMGNIKTEPEKFINGTTTGNLLNYGFAVKNGEHVFFLNTGEGAYKRGSLIKSNVKTQENSLVMEDSGLYMNLVDEWLYYCKPDGIYKTKLENPNSSLVIEGNISLLQILNDNMYYVVDGEINSVTTAGENTDFTAIKNANGFNIYKETVYYINTENGYIYKADLNGGNIKAIYEHSVDMFYIIDDVIYFIDSDDSYIKRMTLKLEGLETVVKQPCSGFNVNRGGIYYTREIDGVRACCNADPDGKQENVITEFGDSQWHIVCMFNEGASILKVEDLEGIK